MEFMGLTNSRGSSEDKHDFNKEAKSKVGVEKKVDK